ncbi:hypothetical protein LAY57_10365 [Argonema antarcticum A004/B2]|nr:hypothetical protein [Argonema antarcticum A004/B2]
MSVSDHAVSELAPFMAAQITSQPPQRPNYTPNQSNSTVPSQKIVPSTNLLPIVEEAPQLPADTSQNHHAETNGSGVSKYFERDGEMLIPNIKDFKGKNWAEQQRRFILLYTKAYYDFFGQPVPSEDHFKLAAKRASILDTTNFPKYLTGLKRQYLSQISGGYKLNHDGEKEVNNIIAQIEDENVEAGHQYWQRSVSATTKRTRLSKDDKDKLKKWAQDDVELGELKIRDITKATDYALVALWIITVHLKKEQAIRWNDGYYYLKDKFKTISVEAESFSRAMSKQTNEKYFRRSGELYYLTSQGQQIVEGWINGKPIDSLIDVENDMDD